MMSVEHAASESVGRNDILLSAHDMEMTTTEDEYT